MDNTGAMLASAQNEDATEATASPSCDELLAEFYALTYEEAVLVGGSTAASTDTPQGNGSPSRLLTRRSHSPGRALIPDATAELALPLPMPIPLPSLRGPASPTRQSSDAQPQPQPQPQPPTTSSQPSVAPLPQLSRELMNALLPPKTWRDPVTHSTWQRHVRLTPSPRSDTLRLQSLLSQLLVAQQARASAICPVREKCHLQVFEELIREVACDCPERGLLLLRVRDELRLSMEAYQTLYHNGIAYGRHKAVQAEEGTADAEREIARLKAIARQRLRDKHALTHQLLLLEARVQEEVSAREQRHALHLRFLREQHAELTAFHDALTQDAPTSWKH